MPIHPFREEDKETGNSITRDGASKMYLVIQKMKEPQTPMQLNTADFYTSVEYWNYHRNCCVFSISISSQDNKKKKTTRPKPKTKNLQYLFILPKPYPVGDRPAVPPPNSPFFFRIPFPKHK